MKAYTGRPRAVANKFIAALLHNSYRLFNLNAAQGCAQLKIFAFNKCALAMKYPADFTGSDLQFLAEHAARRSNYWLNALICDSHERRDNLLNSTNDAGVITRPNWVHMKRLPAYAHCRQGLLIQADWLEARVVNLTSSVLPQ